MKAGREPMNLSFIIISLCNKFTATQPGMANPWHMKRFAKVVMPGHRCIVAGCTSGCDSYVIKYNFLTVMKDPVRL
ncbi:THAP-type domain-containing protein [Aphis craccivora]|uniref:THAP-type domain-containing protein n=1 Tax=Aphis craccivora TaxID=307492 RepID=A0A6G0YG12_APHCR|nr:THAP-type domain-containing protein [Aphis craccivora]